jgi:hypothetical protein
MQIAIWKIEAISYLGESTERMLPPMNGIESSTALWLLVCVQLLGIGSAWTARISQGSSLQALTQRVFFTTLLLMGFATTFALAVGPGIWLACAASLSVMVLVVTCDFGIDRESA